MPVSEPELPDGVDLLAGTEMPDEVESEESTEEELLLLASRFAFESISRGTAGAAQAVNETAAVDNKTKPELLIKLEAGQSMAKSELDFGLMAKLTDLESLNGNTSETSNKLESVESLANRNQTLELRALNPTRVELAVPNRVGTLGWGESMAGKISLMMNQRLTSAKIHINPPELGPIEVRVNLNNDQASVQFTSHSSQVRDALEQSIPRLREMLETAGFSLADADVKDQSSDRQSDESGDADPETQEIADAETMQSRPISMGLIDERV